MLALPSIEPSHDFSRQARSSDGLYSWCKPCHSAIVKEIRLKKLYGLTVEELDERTRQQDGRCAICGARPNQALEIDHDHTTNSVRQLLCGPCNRMLGLAKHDPELLRRAADYIERHQAAGTA